MYLILDFCQAEDACVLNLQEMSFCRLEACKWMAGIRFLASVNSFEKPKKEGNK